MNVVNENHRTPTSAKSTKARVAAGRVTAPVAELPVVGSPSKPKSRKGVAKTVRDKLLGKFTQSRGGEVVLSDGDETFQFGGRKNDTDLSSHIFVHDSKFYSDIMLGGTIGSAEAYIAGHWDCSDLTSLIRIMIRNMDRVSRMDKAVSKIRSLAYKLNHSMRRNSKAGSRKNIQQHYDLGNDFYQTFLDPSMNYSSGIFDAATIDTFPYAEDDLHAASLEKMDRICQKLQLSETDHVLEIGTGWGAMAIHIAENYGCRVTTTTISDEQFSLATDRVVAAGLKDRITVLKQDYRDLSGTFDKIVSIEMVEAVGHKFMGTFFETCYGTRPFVSSPVGKKFQ